jgi:predicted metal-dependent hydrolase
MAFDYVIKFSRRKTLALKVNKNGEVIVAAPMRCSKKAVKKFVESNTLWIEKALLKVEIYQKKSSPKKYILGEIFFFKGEKYPLIFIDDIKDIKLTQRALQVPTSHKAPAKLIYNWYMDNAAEAIMEAVDIQSERLGLYPEKVLVSKMRSSWGTCSCRGRISIAWRLIMAPPDVLNYVVIHELAHLKFLNHSKRFWSFVQEYCPEYKNHKRWLKEHGAYLNFDI